MRRGRVFNFFNSIDFAYEVRTIETRLLDLSDQMVISRALGLIAKNAQTTCGLRAFRLFGLRGWGGGSAKLASGGIRNPPRFYTCVQKFFMGGTRFR